MKIIIVDDDPMVAMINQKYAEGIEGVEVSGVFHRAQDALNYLKMHPIDVIVLDIYMPKMSGLELLKVIHDERISIDSIMITAANDIQSIQKALRYGVFDYLVKPFDYQRFKEALEHYKVFQMQMAQSKNMSQKHIDELFHGRVALKQETLEKGLQEKTMHIVQKYLECHCDQYITTKEIAGALNLSMITVRKYLNFLSDKQEIETELNYTTSGRPSVLYRFRKREV